MKKSNSINNLYGDLSEIYEAMYQSFINYEEEFIFYKQILLKYQCKSLVEIGCGTGNLATLFTKEFFQYTGIDLSEDMLTSARKNHPKCNFVQGDMRSFALINPANACIITGRTISYLLTNKDVLDTFTNIHQQLHESGILCFDFIDANLFIPQIEPGKKITHKASFQGKQYQRDSYWKINLIHGWAFDWHSIFYQLSENSELIKLGEDNSTIRAFTKDEIVIFLQLAGFEIKEIHTRPSYAFDTIVIVAEKINLN